VINVPSIPAIVDKGVIAVIQQITPLTEEDLLLSLPSGAGAPGLLAFLIS
jgi:hypothetical protein